MDSTLVTVVTNQTKCADAAAAYASYRSLPTAPNVFVVEIGANRYLVWDGGASLAGEFSVFVIMDSAYAPITGFSG
jgi:hypothetical protein